MPMRPKGIKQRLDPPLVSHLHGRVQGLVYYDVVVKKDAEVISMTIDNPALSTSTKLDLNKDQINQMITILEKSLEAVKGQT